MDIAIISIISGLIGAIIGGLSTVVAAERTFKKNQDALITGVTHGIYTEINTLWIIYETKFKDAFPILEKVELGEDIYLEKKYPLYLYPQYFSVYDSNCPHIGQISDDQLRSDIVTGYLRARELSDAYLHNNDLLKDLDHLISQQRQTKSDIYDKDIEAAKSALKEHVKYIAEVHNNVKKFYLKAKKRIEVQRENERDVIGDGLGEPDDAANKSLDVRAKQRLS